MITDRRNATETTLNAFVGRPFEFGKYDCGLMVIDHVKRMGHSISVGFTWSNAVGLKRFLNRNGGSGAACLDGWGLPRIPPAFAMMGDVVEIVGEPPFGAFGICIGNGRILAYHEDAEGACIIQPTDAPLNAWRL